MIPVPTCSAATSFMWFLCVFFTKTTSIIPTSRMIRTCWNKWQYSRRKTKKHMLQYKCKVCWSFSFSVVSLSVNNILKLQTYLLNSPSCTLLLGASSFPQLQPTAVPWMSPCRKTLQCSGPVPENYSHTLSYYNENYSSISKTEHKKFHDDKSAKSFIVTNPKA